MSLKKKNGKSLVVQYYEYLSVSIHIAETTMQYYECLSVSIAETTKHCSTSTQFSVIMCLCFFFFPFILDIKFVG